MAKRRYSRGSQSMVDAVGDVSEANEEMWGWTLEGAKSIQYPGVSTCTTVTLHLESGKTMGAHLPYTATKAEADAIFADMNAYRVGKGNLPVTGIDVVGKIQYQVPNDSWLASDAYRPVGDNLYKTLNTTYHRGENDQVRYFNQDRNDMDYQVFEGTNGKIWKQREHKAQGQQAENPWEESMEFEFFE